MIKVMIVDDVNILRTGLKRVIEKDAEMCVIATAANGQEALDMCAIEEPDIILMDLKMPVCDGVEATRLIKKRSQSIKIIILTTFNDDESIKKALINGASGYVLKDIDESELLSTIKNTHKGLVTVHQDVFSSLKNQLENKLKEDSNKSIDKSVKLLSDKEICIINLIAHGKSYREISSDLYIAEGTLRNNVSEILKKLNMKDKTQLIVYAVRNKLI